MENFTPVSAAIGGILIGLSAALLWLMNGRVAGISGILGGLAQAGPGDRAWRVAFLAGMVAAPLLYAATRPSGLAPVTIASSPVLLISAGLLVGFGTRLGGGCTSGHGVCGIARLSIRSLVATAAFMGTALFVVFVMRHKLGA
ncbi:MAG TPA: YeeE/YedE thiosulfate transporter family protein [Stellaceae bacterium]|nr:YeeE/YedE thiosulfate transporter family protein [Stellaceae bacterium]